MKKPKPGKAKRGNRTPWSRSDIVKKGWATRRKVAKAEARAARARSAAVKKSWVTRRANAEAEARTETVSPEQFDQVFDEFEEGEILPDFDQDEDEDDGGEEDEDGDREDEGDTWDVEEPIASSKKKQYKAPTAAPILNWADNPIFENKTHEQPKEIEQTEAAKQSRKTGVREEQRAVNKGVANQARQPGKGKSKVRAAQRKRKERVADQARDKRGRFIRSGKPSKPVKAKRRP